MVQQLDRELIDEAVKTIQMLAVDGVEKARSGHPGAPMGLASIAFALWTHELRYDPAEPQWPNRDRFVLSCGHASMLLYGMLHLSGYDLSIDELKSFRQWGSRTPGHPEAGHTPGVEMTTGPLGQGLATAVGMATSIKMMAARFNSASADLFNARVFGIASDGDLMEGVSAEACSLAGHLGLDNLIFFYDDNSITIDGSTALSFGEDVAKRYEAYGWNVLRADGHDHTQLCEALDKAVAEPKRPSLIISKTHIGKGSPNKQDSSKAHGSPLGPEEVEATKKQIGWPLEPTFHVPDAVKAVFAQRAEQGTAARQAWQQQRDAFVAGGGEAVATYQRLMDKSVPEDLLTQLLEAVADKKAATRALSGQLQQTVAQLVPSLAGGSADLTPSNNTYIKDAAAIGPASFEGRNFHFGVREHAMGAIANGLALGDGFIPYTATFLVFCDYMRPAIRVAALTKLQSIYVFTHDSLYLGEDGPTHQPVEHLWSLRTIPNLDVVRPADGLECAAAWAHALSRKQGPTAFALTRQGVPPLARAEGFDSAVLMRGGYIIDDADGAPEAVIIATGSEVELAIAAKAQLGERSSKVRIVSMPCVEAFERQDLSYRQRVLPAGVRRCSIELGITGPWRGIVGVGGLCIGHDDFGASAPAVVIQEKLGLTPQAVAEKLTIWLERQAV